MKRLLAISLSILAILALTNIAALSQKTQSQDKKDDVLKQIGITEVRLPITVKRKDKFLSGLVESNFEVYEDGKKQKINKFISPSELPLNVGLLIDTSNSVKLKLPIEKDAADDFAGTVTSYRRKDQVLVASFDSDVELHQDFTDSLELISKAIKKLKAGGYTKLFDGVYRVIEEKMATVPNTEARRIIVILSDGEDTASDKTLKDAIEIAQRYDVTIFGISTKNFSGADAGTVASTPDKELERLCTETGGQVFLPSQKIELFRSFREVSDDLRREYVVYYTPVNQDKTGKQREIRVKLLNAEGKLSHKQGYVY
jgi:Ca-activated chloride channel homolog